MKKIIGIISLFFLLVIGIAFSQDNEDTKVDDEVEDIINDEGKASVIVVLEDNPDVLDEYYSASQLNQMDGFEKEKMMIAEQQEEVLHNLDLKNENEAGILSENNYDFDIESKFSIVNGFSGEVTEEGLEKLKMDARVKAVQLDRLRSVFLSDSVPLVNATNTWRLIYNRTNITGKGETICVIDTGIDYTHESLGGCSSSDFLAGNCRKVLSGHDFVNGDSDPIDDEGHGTHVAGIIASTNLTFRGVAPDSNLVALKACDSGGDCSDSDIVSSIDWCVSNASKYN